MAERTCIVTRQTAAPDHLIRFVRAPDGFAIADLAATLPGRGAWVGLSAQNVATAVKRGALQRALATTTADGTKEPIQVAADLADIVDQLLLQAALRYLPLARKAGGLVQGFEKVSSALNQGNVRVLLAAMDASLDGRKKLANRFQYQDQPGKLVTTFTSAQLSLALGRSNVVHAGVTNDGLAVKLMQALDRLLEYRGQTDREDEETQ